MTDTKFNLNVMYGTNEVFTEVLKHEKKKLKAFDFTNAGRVIQQV